MTAIREALAAVKERDLPGAYPHRLDLCDRCAHQGWKAKANRELIAEIKKLISDFDDLEFVKVRGHAGIPLNERADTLATDVVALGR